MLETKRSIASQFFASTVGPAPIIKSKKKQQLQKKDISTKAGFHH